MNQHDVVALRPQEISCQTFADLDCAIKELVGDEPYRHVFRGQRHSSWQLAPRLERVCTTRDLLETENRMLTEFRSKAHLYADHLPGANDSLGWLSAMQHHGIPTRLLDWTYSAFVAMYFAFESGSAGEEGAIWAINTEPLSRVFQTRTHWIRGRPSEPSQIGPEHFTAIAFPPAFGTKSFGLVAPMLPGFHVSRLSSQQGCFLVNCNYRITFEESLADMMQGEEEPWLFRIKFPQSIRVTSLQRLMHLNIHPVSLFPDLEGLARFITLKAEIFPPRAVGFDLTQTYKLMAERSARNVLRRAGRLDSDTVRSAYDHSVDAIRTAAGNVARATPVDLLVIHKIAVAATRRAVDDEYYTLRPGDRPTPGQLKALKDSLESGGI